MDEPLKTAQEALLKNRALYEAIRGTWMEGLANDDERAKSMSVGLVRFYLWPGYRLPRASDFQQK